MKRIWNLALGTAVLCTALLCGLKYFPEATVPPDGDEPLSVCPFPNKRKLKPVLYVPLKPLL